jgi:hypothetical protein
MLAELERIERLLQAYGHVYAANHAAAARTLYRRDPEEAFRFVNGDDWWVGGDSIAAIDLAIDGGFSLRARRDARQLRADLVRLHGLAATRGQGHPTGALVVAQFRKWEASSI